MLVHLTKRSFSIADGGCVREHDQRFASCGEDILSRGCGAVVDAAADMAINVLRVRTLDLWRWLELSSHPAMHGIEWLNVRSSGCRVLGQCNAVACCGAQVVIDVGRRPGEANRGSDTPYLCHSQDAPRAGDDRHWPSHPSFWSDNVVRQAKSVLLPLVRCNCVNMGITNLVFLHNITLFTM